MNTEPSIRNMILEIVDKIKEGYQPDKIVLFGSYAYGRPDRDSDIDLLIIEESNLPRYKRSARYRRALTGLFPAKDILVWTPDEIRAWSAVKNAFICVALREGRVLHER